MSPDFPHSPVKMTLEVSEVPVAGTVDIDTCGKRPAVESDTPETAKKSKVGFEDVAQVKSLGSFDPTFGVSKKSEPGNEDKCENEDEADEDNDESEIEDDEDPNEDATSNVLDELIVMFKVQNGRDPTEDEIKMWVETLKESMIDSSEAPGSASDCDEKDISGTGLRKIRIVFLKQKLTSLRQVQPAQLAKTEARTLSVDSEAFNSAIARVSAKTRPQHITLDVLAPHCDHTSFPILAS